MMHNRAVGVLNILLAVAVLVQVFAPAAWAGGLWMYERGTPEVGTAQAGLMDDPTSATSKLPPIEKLKVSGLADIQRTTLAQAGTPAQDQKKPADCAALEQDLFIDLKEVVKAGCTPSQAQIAKLLENPVGNFVAIPFQYDYVQFKGPKTDTQTVHKLQIMPTFPISLGSDWNLINRVVFPFLSAPVNKAFGECMGAAPGTIITDCPRFPGPPGRSLRPYQWLQRYGLRGADRAQEIHQDRIDGRGGYLGREWVFGIFPQHWWSVGGDSKRADVSLTNIQYFLYYAPPWDPKAQWRIGMTPNISINWKAKGDKVTLPVGLGIGRMFEISKLPVRVQVEVDYSAIHPNDKPGSRWDFRFSFIPVIPTFLF